MGCFWLEIDSLQVRLRVKEAREEIDVCEGWQRRDHFICLANCR